MQSKVQQQPNSERTQKSYGTSHEGNQTTTYTKKGEQTLHRNIENDQSEARDNNRYRITKKCYWSKAQYYSHPRKTLNEQEKHIRKTAFEFTMDLKGLISKTTNVSNLARVRNSMHRAARETAPIGYNIVFNSC